MFRVSFSHKIFKYLQRQSLQFTKIPHESLLNFEVHNSGYLYREISTILSDFTLAIYGVVVVFFTLTRYMTRLCIDAKVLFV